SVVVRFVDGAKPFLDSFASKDFQRLRASPNPRRVLHAKKKWRQPGAVIQIASRLIQSNPSSAMRCGASALQSSKIDPLSVCNQNPAAARCGLNTEEPEPRTMSFIRSKLN